MAATTNKRVLRAMYALVPRLEDAGDFVLMTEGSRHADYFGSLKTQPAYHTEVFLRSAKDGRFGVVFTDSRKRPYASGGEWFANYEDAEQRFLRLAAEIRSGRAAALRLRGEGEYELPLPGGR